MLLFAFAGLALAGTTLALRSAWANRAGRGLRLGGAALLFAAAAVIASVAAGWERGVALAFMASAAPAYAVVAAGASWRSRRKAIARIDADEPAPLPGLAARWLIAGLGGGLAALALGAGMAAWLPAGPALRTVLAVIAFPVAWTLFAGWALATRRPARVLAAALACTLLGGAAAAVVFA